MNYLISIKQKIVEKEELFDINKFEKQVKNELFDISKFENCRKRGII